MNRNREDDLKELPDLRHLIRGMLAAGYSPAQIRSALRSKSDSNQVEIILVELLDPAAKNYGPRRKRHQHNGNL